MHKHNTNMYYVSINARNILMVTLSYSVNSVLTTFRPLFQLLISIETCLLNIFCKTNISQMFPDVSTIFPISNGNSIQPFVQAPNLSITVNTFLFLIATKTFHCLYLQNRSRIHTYMVTSITPTPQDHHHLGGLTRLNRRETPAS